MPWAFISFWGGEEPSPLLLRQLLTGLFKPRMMMNDDERRAIGGMLGRG
jgi:hypothetical protein